MPGQAVQPAAARPDHRRPATPSFIVSHEIDLEHAPEGYERFDKRLDGYSKVVLHPAA